MRVGGGGGSSDASIMIDPPTVVAGGINPYRGVGVVIVFRDACDINPNSWVPDKGVVIFSFSVAVNDILFGYISFVYALDHLVEVVLMLANVFPFSLMFADFIVSHVNVPGP